MADARLTPLASGVHGDIVLCERGGLRVVLKVVQAPEDGDNPNLRPHNIAREAALLMKLRHPNLVEGLSYSFDRNSFEHVLEEEALAVTLADVLSATYPDAEETFGVFQTFAKGIFSALSFLHGHGIAHRDIKPANVMLSDNGTPKLIDFGTAYEDCGDEEEEMAYQVGTGPYRAPELLFSPARYDAPALDLWAAGVTLAEIFRPLQSDVDSDSDDSSPSALSGGDDCRRAPLFDASHGELGLAASIFRRFGSPTATSWPSFSSLPDASKLCFEVREPQPLSSALAFNTSETQRSSVLSLVESVVRLEPSRRAHAADIDSTLQLLPVPSFLTSLLADHKKTTHRI